MFVQVRRVVCSSDLWRTLKIQIWELLTTAQRLSIFRVSKISWETLLKKHTLMTFPGDFGLLGLDKAHECAFSST